MNLADSHCHLTMAPFDADREAVISRAAAAGVSLFITVPARKGDAAACLALAASDERIFATAGLHPHEARLWDGEAEAELRRSLGDPLLAAVGEIGLDFHYDLSPRDAQERAMRAQLGIALEARKPVVIHTRLAPEKTFAILEEERAREVGGIFHCFTEDAQAARRALDLGFYVSFSGIVTFPRAAGIQEAARLVPADRILVETDAPYLAPVPHRGRRNEPAFVESTVRFLAALRGEDPGELAARTVENCRRALRLPIRTRR